MAGEKLIRKWSKYYMYIFFTALFFVLKTLVINIGDFGINTQYNMFKINVVVNNHILMKLLIEYFGYTIFGTLFKIISYKKNKNNIKVKIMNNNISFASCNNYKTENQSKFKTIKLLLIASAFYAIQLMVRTILMFGGVWTLDLWIFNVIFIYIFMKYILHKHFYKHQFYSLIFIFSINLILLISCSGIRHNGINEYDQIGDNYGSYFYIVLFYLVYIALSAFLSSSEVLQKKLMDIYYVSPYSIIFMSGLISGSVTLIAYIIVSNKSCGSKFCPLFHPDYDNGNHFFDNFKIYILNMQERLKEDKVSFYLEIFLVYPLYSFICFFKYLNETLVVWHLNPNFVLLSDNIYYSIKKIIILIYDPTDLKTYLRLFGEIFALIGYLFYLEIFEINICGLNKNTKNNITIRGITESNSDILFDDCNDDDSSSNPHNNINTNKDENVKKTEMVNMGGYTVYI